LGTVEDADGEGLVVDALHVADAARVLLETVAGLSGGANGDLETVSVVRDDDEATALAFDRRYLLTVFPWLFRGPHPGAALLAGLDEAGFNHLPAPVAFWRRAGRDLGVVQELLSGASSGWALAIGSLRDVIASGVQPAAAGGDFAPEALALGTMAARMHVALERAFGRRAGDVAKWVDELGPDVLAAAAEGQRSGFAATSAEDLLASLRRSGLRLPTIRTHGDLHLGRVARTDHGWVLADCMPGGTAPGTEEPLFRCPLADVADLTWSLWHAAQVAAGERGPASLGLASSETALAWQARNRRALLAAYLATPGIGPLLPADRRVVRRLLAMFELARAARGPSEPAPAR
jgi:maltokinase